MTDVIEVIRRIVVEINRRGSARLGIDMTLTPNDWLPDARNGTVVFTARIYQRGQFLPNVWVFPGEPRRITFTLKEVSREKGVCMNFPRNANQNPDLFFAESDPRMSNFVFEEDQTSAPTCPTEIVSPNDNPPHPHHYQKATTKDPVTEATVVIRCEDFGAFGKIEASAPGCESILPREQDTEQPGGTGSNAVKIPRDNNGNNIADVAPQDAAGAAANTDNDSTPAGNGINGDGLTNYEEYRGFIVSQGAGKRHIRTDITVKDIFIRDRDALGLGLFAASGLAIHLLPGPDFYNGDSPNNSVGPAAGRQVVNFNRGHATGGIQHGLRLVNENRPGLYGIAEGSGPGVPRVTNRVVVNRTLNLQAGEPPNRLANTIAHELGHSVNVFHHGDLAQHNHAGTTTDPTGGQTSGVVNCIMRYDNFVTQWCHPANHPPATPHPHPVPAPPNDTVGVQYCNSTQGTGVNSIPAHFSNNASAGRGNCIGSFRVKDW